MSEGVAQLRHEGSQRQVVVAGAIAGLVSRFVIAPLDVIKIRLQLQIHSLSDPTNPHGRLTHSTLGTLRQILHEEGLPGLWKGNIPAELMYLAYGSVQFSAYTSMSHILESLPPPYTLPNSGVSFLSGAAAGAAATTATYPLDLLRTRFAAQGRARVYPSIRACVAHIAQHEGAGGFFRGLGAGVSQIVPYMGLFFASYEALKPVVAESPVPLPFGTSDAAAGVVASVLSKTAVYPLDTTRKRLQVQGPMRDRYVDGRIPAYKGVVSTVTSIWRHEGRRGLYRGLTVSLLKAAPASAVTMWTYERAMASMLAWEEERVDA
ncbi:mitochondrial thiamine pyrophosphate carrier 1 [Dothidotthia symphoricarpi CBS 119687]|uniref:Mitochondrial thiamine pyrophosphate carrier 1 n=1 Tax=Dothidotthia symphoricarpi CBS 119687 TaxID=1392245 RepID=A0A6A6AMZ9_9PLEO|nr:mitochondrial thiamine pyrophosphate carrier 1 [Dothidotthia symphoricarpi CBS 119687]KAF2132518.1 mitochondrial thiamine pyrophosphate carrier 1 [Dothidotthia symphoricarpi CBS 119687]